MKRARSEGTRTRRGRAIVGWVVRCGLVAGCASDPPPAPVERALGPGVAARVGDDVVLAATVARIAGARALDASSARDLAIRDALFASAVRADPELAPLVTVAERAALARGFLEELEARAVQQGTPSDAEVQALSQERWPEFDRPVSVRTTHAVVLVEKPEDDRMARELAARLAIELREKTTSEAFIQAAQAFPVAPLSLRAERLPPVTVDARSWDPAARPGTPFPTIDPDYTRAAHALEKPGDQSPVVKSAFGYHVILLEERIPELRPPLEERRTALRDEIVSRRAKRLLDDTLARLRADTPVDVERAADSLTELVTNSGS